MGLHGIASKGLPWLKATTFESQHWQGYSTISQETSIFPKNIIKMTAGMSQQSYVNTEVWALAAMWAGPSRLVISDGSWNGSQPHEAARI